MVLVATLATMMAVHQQAQITRTTLVLNTDRMYLYAKAVEAWAMKLLADNLKQAENEKNDAAIDVLPQSFSDFQAGYGFTVSGKVTDLQGKFNLNNLVDKRYEANFANLIMAVAPRMDPKDAQNIAISVHDWVSKPAKKSNDPNENATNATTPANSKINHYYSKQHPPYRAAQALMASPSELRLIKGITPSLYTRLQPFITALPRSTPININTASAPVIASLSDTIDLTSAIEIVQNRGNAPFDSISEFLSNQSIQEGNVKESDITMDSQYFLVTAQVKNTSEKLVLHAMLYRRTASDKNMTTGQNNINAEGSTNSEPLITVLWESRGGL